MDVCILGGTGFIGKHLCCAMHKDGIKAIVVSRSPDHEFLRKFAPSVEAHSLGEAKFWDKLKAVKSLVVLSSGSRPSSSWRAPEGEVECNLLPTSVFLRRFIDTNPGCHIIYASSGGQIYGDGHLNPITETAVPSPVTAYGLGKLLTENLLCFFQNIGDIKYSILRIANPVGYWQYGVRHGLVTAAISCGILSKPLVLYGDGKNLRDYFDVDDLCELIKFLIDRTSNDSFIANVGSGKCYTELDIIGLVEGSLQRRVLIDQMPSRQFDLRYAALDVRQVKELTGWSAKTSIEVTIEKIVDRLKVEGKYIY